MKPKDLKFPYKWEERRPFLQDRVFYIPNYYFHHQEWRLPDFSHESIFGNEKPIHIEFCSGNGEWIIEKAKSYPEMNWVAVEKNFDRVRKIWSKRENEELQNLLIISGYAEEFINFYVKEDSFSQAFINFPDPWPKEKHAKNRLIQNKFTLRLSHVLKKDAQVHVVTDEENYLRQILEQMIQSNLWKPYFPPPYFIINPSNYGHSWFERLWKDQGKEIFHCYFINQKDNI